MLLDGSLDDVHHLAQEPALAFQLVRLEVECHPRIGRPVVLAKLERLTDQDVRIVEPPFEQGELGPVDPGEPELGGLPKFLGDPGHGLERLASGGSIPGFRQCVESILVSGVGPFGVLDLFRDRDQLIGDRPAPIDHLRAHVRAVPALECVRQRGPVSPVAFAIRNASSLIASRGAGGRVSRNGPAASRVSRRMRRSSPSRPGAQGPLRGGGAELRRSPQARGTRRTVLRTRAPLEPDVLRRAGAAGELGGRQERLPGTLLIAEPTSASPSDSSSSRRGPGAPPG